MHAKTKPQGAPLEGGRGGEGMARIDNAELVCCCIRWKADMIVSICMQKLNPWVYPGSQKWKINIGTPGTL